MDNDNQNDENSKQGKTRSNVFVDEFPAKEEIRKWETIFKYAAWGIVIVEAENNTISFVNPALAAMYGYQQSEIIGMKLAELFAPEARALLPQFIDKINETGNLTYESIHQRNNGQKFPVLIDVTAFKDTNDKIIFRAANIRDISERKIAEENLRYSEERWKFALEGSGDGIWDWNVQTNEVFFSTQWKAMLGFDEDEISNTLTEWEKRVHPDDIDKVYADLKRHFSGETKFYINEHRVLCKDGSYKWILDRGKVMSWTIDNEPLRVIGTHSDISERIINHQQINELSNVVQNSLNEIYIFDCDTLKFLFVNKGALMNLGYSFDEMLKISPLDIKPEINKEFFEHALISLVSGEKELINFETVHQRKNGTIYPVQVNIQLFYFDGKKVFLAIILDITQRIQTEKEIVKLNEELEQKVIQRTLELEKKYLELERVNKLFVDRELRMIELKDKIKMLEEKLFNKDQNQE